ncbi:MAG: lipopolysaccharide transport periplasmic protein LptA [Nitrospiraceae bacterium]|nr:MAG: lipopolysaccharide transport periplasmic protein LptA [Nitrospiraceae bacterium]UCH44045.1 MAG: lipopolysaccharide transport periplasmic protein LptA [Nitrospiraceae bacterium]
MWKPFFTANLFILVVLIHSAVPAASTAEKANGPVVITSRTLTADNRNNKAVFEGNVIAKTEDITIHADRMIVSYDNSENKVSEIKALGNVKVHRQERAMFSEEAVYIDNEKKIVFKGNPRAVEGENVITGTTITFFLDDDRAVVEGSRVILKNEGEIN